LGNVLIAEPSNNYRNNHKKSEPRFFSNKTKSIHSNQRSSKYLNSELNPNSGAGVRLSSLALKSHCRADEGIGVAAAQGAAYHI